MNKITSLKKHMNLDHAYAIVAKTFEKKVNNFMRGTKQRQLTRKKNGQVCQVGTYLKKFVMKDSFKKDMQYDVQHKKFF